MAVNKKRVKHLPNPAIPLFQKRINIICIICGVVIPIIANYVLSFFWVITTNNHLYETENMIFLSLVSAFTIVSMFTMYGVIVNSIVRFGLKKSVVPLSFGVIRMLLYYIFLIELSSYDARCSFFAFFKSQYNVILVDMGIELLLLIGVVLLTLFLRNKFINENNTNITVRKLFDFKNPLLIIYTWVIILIFAFSLSGCITKTITTVMSNNNYDTFALVTSYIKAIGKSAVGYVIMWGCAKFLDFQWKCLNKAK